jgi:hypothetical protein
LGSKFLEIHPPASYRRTMRLRSCWRATVLFSAIGALGCGECEKDFDCPGTKVCNVASAQCEAFVCDDDADCPPDRACRKNKCTARPAPAVPALDAFVVSAPPAVGSAGDVGDAGGLTPLSPPD